MTRFFFLTLGLLFISSSSFAVTTKPLSDEELYQQAVKLLDLQPHSNQHAIDLLTEAGGHEHLPSIILLSACCMEGIGTAKNTDAAVQMMAMAANKGSAEAQRRLALYYNEGLGVKRDPITAFHWFKKAADQGDALGLYFLGTFYSQGIATEQDANKALNCFLKAAYKNEPHAQTILAACYADGFGVQRNYAEAYAWALIAAENGLPNSKNQLYPILPQRALNEGRPRALVLKKKIVTEKQQIMKKIN